MLENFSDRACRAVVQAEDEARILNHHYVGTEHLLLSLVHDDQGTAARALESLGIGLGAVRREAEQIIGHGRRTPSGHIPVTPEARKVLGLAARESKRLDGGVIGTEHLLLGLIRENDGVAAQVLIRRGASLRNARQHVIQLAGGRPSTGVIGVARRLGQKVRTEIIK